MNDTIKIFSKIGGVFNVSLFSKIFFFVYGSANAPWKWDDKNDDFYPGAMFYDPAGLVSSYFSGFEDFDTGYLKTMLSRN